MWELPELDAWEFVNRYHSAHDHWRWRRKNAQHKVVVESTPFPLFLSCLADARLHGFDVTVHPFSLVNE